MGEGGGEESQELRAAINNLIFVSPLFSTSALSES